MGFALNLRRLWAVGRLVTLIGIADAAPVLAQPQTAVPVRVEAAGPAADAGRIEASGVIAFKRETSLSFKTGGVIKAYAVDIGDAVKAGQLLVSADLTDVSGRRAESEAAYAQAKAALERAEQLAEKGFATDARLDEARAAFQRAQAARNSARFDESRAALTAPSDGVVLIKHAEAGQQMAPGAPVITIGDAGSGLILTAAVSDHQIERIQIGDLARIRAATRDAQTIPGRVTRLGSKADRITGAFDVEITIDAVPPGLRSGSVGTAMIIPSVASTDMDLMAIPAIALLEGRGDLAYVYVVKPDNTAVRVAVTVARFLDEKVLLKQGLKRGDRVVVAGGAYLRNGQKVTIVAGGPP
jgi:RND family efflux transporter MFP subunit